METPRIFFAFLLVLMAHLTVALRKRANVDLLTPTQKLSLQKAMREVNDDNSSTGYAAIAAYHGYPASCKHGDRDIACCIHGMPSFPAWHRLYVLQMELALKKHGLGIGIPFWDWTQPITKLPDLVSEKVFIDSDGGKAKWNVWYQGDIPINGEVVKTARAVDDRLFQKVVSGENTNLYEQVLNALEYHNYCEFEVQFEVAHNTIHYLVGGRNTYSMSHLEYTSYDPIFFLHHSNVDRIYAIFEKIQEARGYHSAGGCTKECELCDLQGFQTPLEPFSRESNPFEITRTFSTALKSKFFMNLGYAYTDITLNGQTVDDLMRLFEERAKYDRAFADFRLYGIGGSANVRVEVCKPANDDVSSEVCEFAGDFFILGGPLEMQWHFSRPYHFEITKTVKKMGLPLDGNYFVKAELFSVNGTQLPSDLLPEPSVNFRPAKGKTDPPIRHNEAGHEHKYGEEAVRKDISRLSREEVFAIREAMDKFQNDVSVDGYQATAEFHGDPGKCPFPTAKNRMACCIHGMPTFPHWHRLFVTQIEDALRRRGSPIGVPYWDWTKPGTTIPALAGEEKYTDPETGEEKHNPFHDVAVAFMGPDARTSRDVLGQLSEEPEWGQHTSLFDAFLLALEQDDYCSFEVQFEVAHNMIHGLVGGTSQYGLSSLSYSAYDPIFFLHHSNTDRIWAIWTALQEYRGKPYKAHCAQSYVYQPLKPFAFSSPYNNNEKTYKHSTPTNVYDYESELGYVYDTLEFGGMGIAELDTYIKNNQEARPRTFVGIMLKGIQKSAMATVYITTPAGDKYNAGQFALLGGPTEMPWRFDRVYRHDVTRALEQNGLSFYQPFEVTLEMVEFDGTAVDVSQFPRVMLIHKAKTSASEGDKSDLRLRKNVDQLTEDETLNLRKAMTALQGDKSAGGFQDLGRYHGIPKWCPRPDAEKLVACCTHGMPVFPHWHRLLAVQSENALNRFNFDVALPYWDWTRRLTDLPALVRDPTYLDPSTGEQKENPFFSALIDDAGEKTTRQISPSLFEEPAFGEYTDVARQVMLALEQTDFCDFEVQFEIAHNFIHALVGGNQPYSMASLKYTAFDPLFYLHHSNTDRIWAIWQALQKYRNKPHNSANCAISQMRKPLAPFSLPNDVNPDTMTQEHSVPFRVFDYRNNFHYEYDNLEFNGLNIPQLQRQLEANKGKDRVFAGFQLHGIKQSALVKFYICKSESDCDNFAGEFYVLGDDYEMPWKYDRLYKYEITNQLKDLGIHYNDRYYLRYDVHGLDGNIIGSDQFPEPTVLFEPGTSRLYGQEYREAVTTASHVRRDLESLSEGEIESLRSAFLAIQKSGKYEEIASFHGAPGLCENNGKKVGCCVHGMPTFPAWHRLYVEQVEEELLSQGSSVAVPYWDWTKAISKLPELISEATYFNSRQQRFDPNPFFSGKVSGEDATTTRDVQSSLFNNKNFYEQTLLAFEQDNFCDFEIQFEMVHNLLHSYVGGRAQYSLSSLDYSAFDPIFFLHHANTDRIWAIWQELQRFRGLPYNEADCAINQMRKPLKPFDSQANQDHLTSRFNRPADTFDYRNHFNYEYDTLNFNGMSVQQLENLLNKRKEEGRVFAGFLLHNIGLSADAEIYLCVPTGRSGEKNCKNKAGTFAVLGGDLEMPFTFDRLYKYEITETVRDLGLRLDNAANFELKVQLRAANGSYLSSDLLPKPTIFFQPGTGDRQEPDGSVSRYLVRKSVNSLNPYELQSLLMAMKAVQEDSSADGFQSIASFHAVPPLCPSPSASRRYACCLHGMATFPQWHRLYTVQMEDALKRHGSVVGIPYWDWTRQNSELPHILTDETFVNLKNGETYQNPWHHANIEFKNRTTERDVVGEKLFANGKKGWDTWLFQQTLFALEQDNYCDFEIQFEITHNAVHSWIGGSSTFGLGHLHYASYDPAFYLHHSNTDRIWAVWQALQKYRGKNPNEANCALEQMREPLKPFSFGPPYNLNDMTKEYSKPEDTFEYEEHFHYRYDDLEYVGMTVPLLHTVIKERQERDRVFAGFLLKGFGQSASVSFNICTKDMVDCFEAGYFTVLGGPVEMPWQFDRVFKYEITDQLKEHNLRFDDDYHFHVYVKDIEGNELDSSLIPVPSVIFQPGAGEHNVAKLRHNHVRRNLNNLTERDVQSLKAAMRDLQLDTSNDGWGNLASFHGAPARCPDPANPSIACCLHGMPTFPHWHRLYTLQVEQALRRHGSSIAIPYWDWTRPIKELPKIFTDEDFYDVWRDEVVTNPFVRGYVASEDTFTVRDIQSELHLNAEDEQHSALFDLVLSALEQTDYCDFEVQFEVMHNAIHYLVGGPQKYSLSSLEYSAYDPIFLIHHSFTDKVWAVWQELQKNRHLPYDRADCALNKMTEPMKPFTFEGFNLNKFTKSHATPNDLFSHEELGYGYDNMDIGGYSISDLEKEISRRQSEARVFAGFLLHGVETSADLTLKVCKQNNECLQAGRLFLLGGPLEMPWSFDRLVKYDITRTLKEAGLNPEDVYDAEALFTLKVEVRDVNGNVLNAKKAAGEPTLIYQPASGASEDVGSHKLAGVGVRKDVSSLTNSEISSIRKALRRVQEDTGPNGFASIAAFHGSPPGCEFKGRKVACCEHGMASFPQWHRLFVKQFEDALTSQGAQIGIPYWDWTTAFTALPSLVTEEEDNPFHHFVINGEHQTSRAPREQLFNDPEFGSTSFFYRQALLVFEQTDYCDFEVQFEITHNAIHSWTGGRSPYGMSTLEYTAYDPLFLLHHSNVDRQFAIWQALQKYRGLPYNKANCAIQDLKKPMRPFSDDSNINSVTRANSRPIDAFDYDRFNYQYDNLNFHGLTIAELNSKLEERKQEDRIFAEFLLHGFGASADVVFKLCDAKDHCEFAGTFAVLGGPLEMPWAFDRLFKYDVTKTFKKLDLRPDSIYHFEVNITAVNGSRLDSGLIRSPSVQFVPGVKDYYSSLKEEQPAQSDKLLRKSVNELTLEEAKNLKNALNFLQQDQGPQGFEAIAGFHGFPYLCPQTADDKYACCVHGMPVFPHWHRLLTVQFEKGLEQHGARIGVPYWDWTKEVKQLPSFFGDSSLQHNPFYDFTIRNGDQKTVRDVQSSLYNPHLINGHNYLYYLALSTLEEDSYCDFEVQFEVLHNEIHALIGGKETFSMATLDYSAFDPFFMIHHSSIDRIWVIWQELQKLRRKPFNAARCAGNIMDKPLHPFSYPEVNHNKLTRDNALPSLAFDSSRFGYEFDNLDLNGHKVNEIHRIIQDLRHQDRLYLAFVLLGKGQSLTVKIELETPTGHKEAGSIHILGGPKEMPWAYERVFKYDITDVAKASNLKGGDSFKVTFKKKVYNQDTEEEYVNECIVGEKPAYVDYDILNIPFGQGIRLPPKIIVKKGTRFRFVSSGNSNIATVEDLGSFTTLSFCTIPPFSYNSYKTGVVYALPPGDYYFTPKSSDLCNANVRIQITVEEE